MHNHRDPFVLGDLDILHALHVFGMLLDGTKEASKRLENMLFWDVNNGIARRNWARNEGAIFAIKRAMETQPLLKVTIPNAVDASLLEKLI